MANSLTIYQLGEAERELMDVLYENGGELTPEIEEALTETREGLSLKVEGYNRIIRELTAYSDAAKAEADRIAERSKRAKNAAERLKAHILDAMRLYDWTTLEGAERGVKITRSKRKRIDVDMEAVSASLDLERRVADMRLPEYVKVTTAVDKTALKRMFDGTGVLPAGCTEGESEFITIR